MSELAPLVVLIGPPGAGKSVLGRLLAKHLRSSFVDTDRRIVAQHGPIAQIFEEHGEEWFRAAERVEVAKALGERAVVALGGGAVLNKDTQADLADARVVLVTVSPAAVEQRIKGATRPLIREGLDSWNRLVEQRMSVYQRLATKVVDSSDRTAASLASELAEWVQKEEQA